MFDTAASDFGPVPADAQAIAPYMDRRYRNVDAARARFPHLFAARMVVTIAAGEGDADIIDWEPGNTDPPPGRWYDQQHRRGRWRPGFYADLSDGRLTVVPALEQHLGALGPAGPDRLVRIWTAHPTGIRHLCGPGTCGQFPIDADATQYWWTSIQGRWPGADGEVDVSVARLDFFHATPTPHPHPIRTEDMITAVVKQDGRLEVFVEKQDGRVFHAYQEHTHGGWAGAQKGVRNAQWFSLGTPGDSASTSTEPAQPEADQFHVREPAPAEQRERGPAPASPTAD